MSQLSTRFQVVNFSGMNNADFVPILAPFHGVRKVVINNPDGSDAITFTTEDDSPPQTDTIAAEQSLTIDLNTLYPVSGPKPWGMNEVICYIKGAGDQPIIHFYGGLVE